MEKPHIGLSYDEGISSDVFDEFLSIISNGKLNIMVEVSESPGPMATYEWLIPTAVIVYIGRSYFDSFLKEMGKDHYQILKKGLATLREGLVGKDSPQMTIISTPGKVSKSNKYSLVFSIWAESGERFGFKLLIQNDVGELEYEKITSSFIEFLNDFHSKSLDEKTMTDIVQLSMAGGVVLCAYDFENLKLEFLDPRLKS